MPNVVIIGSNSFTGSHFCKYLIKKKFTIIAISRSSFPLKEFTPIKKNKRFEFHKLDINKNLDNILKIILRKKPKYIVNFASQSMVGESWNNPKDWLYTNSVSIPLLYDKISKLSFKTKLVHVSTPEVYGDNKRIVDEKSFYNPTTPYAVSRTTADFYLNILKKNFNLDYIITRAANVYGEYQSIYRIVPKTIYCILNKKKLLLEGSGKSYRSFIHVHDVCSATYKLMIKKNYNKNDNRIYNISTNQLISIKQLVKKICNQLGYDIKKLIKIAPERRGKDKRYFLKSQKIHKIGWSPQVELENGIFQTYLWLKKINHKIKDKNLHYKHKK